MGGRSSNVFRTKSAELRPNESHARSAWCLEKLGIVRSDFPNAPRTRSRTRVCKKQKISHALCCRVSPPPLRREAKKEMEGNFLVLLRRFILPKRLISHVSGTVSAAFSPSALARTLVSAFGANSIIRSHFAALYHVAARFARGASSVLASCSLSGFSGVPCGSSLCLPHPPSARTSPSTNADGSLKN